MPEKAESSIDLRLIERGRDYRRVVPKEIDDRLIGLLVEVPKETHRVTVGGEIEEIPEEERKRPRLKIEKLSDDERIKLDELEREVVKLVIRELVRPATYAIGVGNQNIVPYENRFTVDAAVQEFRELENVVTGVTGENTKGRGKEVLDEIRQIERWMEGNAGLLKGSGPILAAFFDGWGAIANAVRTVPRHDVTTTELYNLYSSLGEHLELELGKEIQSNQDQVYEVMRGVSAVHRHWGRNGGVEMEKDYPITPAQVEFVERVFGHNPRDENGNETKSIETVWAILDKPGAKPYLENYLGSNGEGELTVAIGQNALVTEKLLKGLLAEARKGYSMWVNGVEWPIDRNTVEELDWKVGSGDRIFIGKRYSLPGGEALSLAAKLKERQQLAILRETPREINNLFVMAQDPDRVVQVKRKLAVMMNNNVWEKLQYPGVDVEQVIDEFNRKFKEYEKHGPYGMDILDEHIIETARIALLYFCESGELGWGFEYKDDKAKGKAGETNVVKRIVSFGGIKAATDVPTPFKWLWTEANNGWRFWSHGMLPMDERTKRQILEHEPGWAPWVDKKAGLWRVNFLKQELLIDVSPTFPMSFLETATLVNAGPEFRKEVSGKMKPMRIFDLIRFGPSPEPGQRRTPLRMSEVPWRRIIQEAPLRWYVTLSQIAMGIALLSRLPDRETVEKFFGERIDIAKNVQLLELMKRQALGWRDMEADEDVKKFLPFTVALFTAWQENLLEASKNPGVFDEGHVKQVVRKAAISIGELKPKGDEEMGKGMASRYKRYMEQLLPIGKQVLIDIGKKNIRSWFR